MLSAVKVQSGRLSSSNRQWQASTPEALVQIQIPLPAVGALNVADPVSHALQLRLVQQAALIRRAHAICGRL